MRMTHPHLSVLVKKMIQYMKRITKKLDEYRILRDFKFANSCGIGPVSPLLSMYLKEKKNAYHQVHY